MLLGPGDWLSLRGMQNMSLDCAFCGTDFTLTGFPEIITHFNDKHRLDLFDPLQVLRVSLTLTATRSPAR
jgi:hypothetical protein